MKKVVHCKKEPYDVYIGRGSKYGNPFSNKPSKYPTVQTASLKQSIYFYEQWILNKNPNLYITVNILTGMKPPTIEEIKNELKDKILGCWCSPNACHGDILLMIANEE